MHVSKQNSTFVAEFISKSEISGGKTRAFCFSRNSKQIAVTNKVNQYRCFLQNALFYHAFYLNLCINLIEADSRLFQYGDLTEFLEHNIAGYNFCVITNVVRLGDCCSESGGYLTEAISSCLTFSRYSSALYCNFYSEF